MVRLRLNPAALAAFENSGNKYVILGPCLYCDSPEYFGFKMFSAPPGELLFLDGRAVVYSTCKVHALPNEPDTVQRIIELAKDPLGRVLLTIDVVRGP